MHIKTLFAVPVVIVCALGFLVMLGGIAFRLMFGGADFMPELQLWSCLLYLAFGVPAGLIAYADPALRRMLRLR